MINVKLNFFPDITFTPCMYSVIEIHILLKNQNQAVSVSPCPKAKADRARMTSEDGGGTEQFCFCHNTESFGINCSSKFDSENQNIWNSDSSFTHEWSGHLAEAAWKTSKSDRSRTTLVLAFLCIVLLGL